MDAIDEGRFYGVRNESFFFAPFASTSSITVSTKHLFYIMMSAAILVMIGFERFPSEAAIVIPLLIFMMVYKHRGVHMEYVLSYALKSKGGKNKLGKPKKKEDKTLSLYSAASFGRSSTEAVKGSKRKKGEQPIEKEIKHIKLREEDVYEIVLDVGIKHRLKKVDVEIDGHLINRDNTESNGTILILLNGNFENGIREITVRESENRNIIGREKVRVEIV